MSCERFESELSLNLDGRLSSARRDALLDHLQDCAGCESLAEEMRAAQDLALGLRAQRIGEGFHETLWERIRAGEGTPDAVFREPVPLRTKARYLLSGAAAAAALLFTAHVLFPDNLVLPDSQQATPTEVARVETPTATPPAAAPRATFVDEVTPTSVAQVGAVAAVASVYDLQNRLTRLEPRILQEPPAAVRRELAEPIETLGAATRLMLWMREQDTIDLPGELLAELRLAETSIGMLERAEEPRDVELALRQFRDLRAENLRKQFHIVCCKGRTEFLIRFQDHFRHNPNVMRILQIVVPDEQPDLPLGSSIPWRGARIFVPPLPAAPPEWRGNLIPREPVRRMQVFEASPETIDAGGPR
jgi:hypothetical protein